jgi:hypothetical protein
MRTSTGLKGPGLRLIHTADAIAKAAVDMLPTFIVVTMCK